MTLGMLSTKVWEHKVVESRAGNPNEICTMKHFGEAWLR